MKALINDSVERVDQGTPLADQASAPMSEVVASIRRVTHIMGEISAAGSEQSMGVSQVEEAVTQMDQATQQNAALVEESTAAAMSLREHAHHLNHLVGTFRLCATMGWDGPTKAAGGSIRTAGGTPGSAIAAPDHEFIAGKPAAKQGQRSADDSGGHCQAGSVFR